MSKFNFLAGRTTGEPFRFDAPKHVKHDIAQEMREHHFDTPSHLRPGIAARARYFAEVQRGLQEAFKCKN